MAKVVSPWVGSGVSEHDARRPKISDDYQIASRSQIADDYNGDTSLRVDEITCSDEVLAAIRANPIYIVLS